jgi:hypothetical protein
MTLMSCFECGKMEQTKPDFYEIPLCVTEHRRLRNLCVVFKYQAMKAYNKSNQ